MGILNDGIFAEGFFDGVEIGGLFGEFLAYIKNFFKMLRDTIFAAAEAAG